VEVDGVASTPVIDESGVLYVGTAKGTIYAINDTATILWNYSTGAGSTKGLAVTRAQDVLAAVGQSLFSVHDGQPKWKFQDGDGTAFPPIHDRTGTVYFGKGSDFYALSITGQKLWQIRLGGPVTTAPAMDRSGRIYVATATQLYCIADVDAP
jgi:outer membrane protein assembly factor BamB